MLRLRFASVTAALLLLAPISTGAQQQPLGVPLLPYNTDRVEQMSFDPTRRTLYLAAAGRHTIIQVSEVSTAPLTPSPGAPWAYSIVAGRDGLQGPPGATEMNATAATFSGPSGVVGWPQYAVGPTTAASASSPWVGLWIADFGNHAMRFIHFGRGNNVTLVAGSPSGSSGAQDGLGTAALLTGPTNVAWGRFLRRAVLGPTPATTTTATIAVTWTSVVYWTDQSNHCLRQGVPLHNDTSPLEDILMPPDGAPISDMILNVSTFAGLCSNSNGSGTGVGPVVSWGPMFNNPWGIALVGLPAAPAPPAATMTTTVLFIGDYFNNRLCMIAPMYPSAARTLTALTTGSTYAMTGVTIGRVRSLSGPLLSSFPAGGPPYTSSTSSTVVGVELHVGTYSRPYLNVSLRLWVNTTTANTTGNTSTPNASMVVSAAVGILQGGGNVTTTTLVATSGIRASRNAALIRYQYNTTAAPPTGRSSNSTLAVYSGEGGTVLEFYCCLDSSYSDALVLEDSTATEIWTPPAATPVSTSTRGVPLLPYNTGWVEQMAFDPTNRTLYLTNFDRHTIVQASEVSTAPLTPSSGAPWPYSIVAGRDGTSGPPSATEINATAATFSGPTGVVGWPRYAVGPTTAASASSPWVGLWIADYGNHAMRFIHFGRGNNVTLVAGSPSGSSGAQDGLGAAALLTGPRNVAWGRFPRRAVLGPTPGTTTTAVTWTSVVYWTDQSNHCLRQGVPLHSDTSPLEDILMPPDAATAALLGDMIMIVSTFAGVCNRRQGAGSWVGPVVPWRRMFNNPWGIALVGLPAAPAPPAATMTTSALFIGDYDNGRLCMIAPMYPSAARTLTVLTTSRYDPSYHMTGVTIGRVRSVSGPLLSSFPAGGPPYTSSTSSTVVGVELHVGTEYVGSYLNVSLQLTTTTNTTHNTTTLTAATTVDPTTTLVATLRMWLMKNTAFVRYHPQYNTTAAPPTGRSSNGTLVVNSGQWAGVGSSSGSFTASVLEFYCCLDSSYSDALVLEDSTARGEIWAPPPVELPVVWIVIGVVGGAAVVAAAVGALVCYRRQSSRAAAAGGGPTAASATNDVGGGPIVMRPAAVAVTVQHDLPARNPPAMTPSAASPDPPTSQCGTPEEDRTSGSLCVICLSRATACACVPCGHVCLCHDERCKEGARRSCPICRHPVTSFFRVYIS